MAWYPARAAVPARSVTASLSRKQYDWSHSGPVAAAAISSRFRLEKALTTRHTPDSPQPRAVAGSPCSWTSVWYAMGATPTGIGHRRPSRSTDVSGRPAPVSTRVRSHTSRNAARLVRRVRSWPAPPSMKSHTAGSRRLRASDA
ncbi:hypothetical protein QWU11_36670 [Actinomadura sp. DC4]|nr:hypothetical protein [Actinomadura sp. DC4]MDN3358161.1 hypothetical protein [Actinomadura sp. DC4]